MTEFFGIEAAAGHARRLIDQNETSVGIVDADLGLHFYHQNGQSQAVKYVARHVSARLPLNLQRHETPCPTRTVLKRELGSIDRTRIPEFFGTMLDHLLRDEQLELPSNLYRAAFGTELQGPLIFVQLMTESKFRERIVYELLHGAGYDVQRPQKCDHCGIPASLVCVRCGTFYCCREHQQMAWRTHKPRCAALRSDQSP
jgi:hypothetical protein